MIGGQKETTPILGAEYLISEVVLVEVGFHFGNPTQAPKKAHGGWSIVNCCMLSLGQTMGKRKAKACCRVLALPLEFEFLLFGVWIWHLIRSIPSAFCIT